MCRLPPTCSFDLPAGYRNKVTDGARDTWSGCRLPTADLWSIDGTAKPNRSCPHRSAPGECRIADPASLVTRERALELVHLPRATFLFEKLLLLERNENPPGGR